jgi:hypothetical protein
MVIPVELKALAAVATDSPKSSAVRTKRAIKQLLFELLGQSDRGHTVRRSVLIEPLGDAYTDLSVFDAGWALDLRAY